MSFAQEVKREVVTNDYSTQALKAELYGIIKLKAEYIISKNFLNLEIVTTSLFIARRIATLFIKVYDINLNLAYKKRHNLDKRNLYYLVLEDCFETAYDLGLIDEDKNIIDVVSDKYTNQMDSVLRGMFIANGSVNDPQKSNYHLEISCDYKEEVDYIIDVLSSFDINAKMVNRKERLIVYIKRAEHIGDFLKLIGGTNTLFYFENERIKRDLNNVVNRVLNCDIANSDRTQTASLRQLNEIKFIEFNVGFSNLTNRLMEVILLRTTHQDSSLSELSELSEETVGRYLSKSHINHCLREIGELAKKTGFSEED